MIQYVCGNCGYVDTQTDFLWSGCPKCGTRRSLAYTCDRCGWVTPFSVPRCEKCGVVHPNYKPHRFSWRAFPVGAAYAVLFLAIHYGLHVGQFWCWVGWTIGTTLTTLALDIRAKGKRPHTRRADLIVTIWHCPSDEQNRGFAERIFEGIQKSTYAELKDLQSLKLSRTEAWDEIMNVDKDPILRSHTEPPGIPVVVISPAIVSRNDLRKKVLDAAPARNVPGHEAFFICRGIAVADLRNAYPDLAPLYNDIMIGEESDLDALLAELRACIDTRRQRGYHGVVRRCADWLHVFFAGTFSMLSPLTVVAQLAYLVPPIILAHLLLPVPWLHGIAWGAVLFALFAVGMEFNYPGTADLWPWLGRHWRLDASGDGERSLDLPDVPLDLRAIGNWLIKQTHIHPPERLTRPFCTQQERTDAVCGWYSALVYMRKQRVLCLFYLLLPVAAFMFLRAPQMLFPAVAALLAGLFVPPLASRGANMSRYIEYLRSGLTESRLATNRRFVRSAGRLIRADTRPATTGTEPGETLREIEGFAIRQAFVNGRLRGLWFPRADQLFISYAWHDEGEVPIARAVKNAVDQLRPVVPCFLDQRHITSRFAAFRSAVSSELLRSTHVIFIIGPHFRKGEVVQREVATTLQRWYVEVLPTVICVVEPEVASALLKSDDLSPTLQLLLTWCPCLSVEEATNPTLLGRIIAQRRRQGLWRDWCTLFAPGAALQRMTQSFRI